MEIDSFNWLVLEGVLIWLLTLAITFYAAKEYYTIKSSAAILKKMIQEEERD